MNSTIKPGHSLGRRPLFVSDEGEMADAPGPAAPSSLEISPSGKEAADPGPCSAARGPRILPVASWILVGSGTNDRIYAEPARSMRDGNSACGGTECSVASYTG